MSTREKLEAKLGGPLDQVLPGGELTARGNAVMYRDIPELNITDPDQILGFTKASPSTQPVGAPAQSQPVRGTVESAEWSSTHKVMNIELGNGSGAELPLIAIFAVDGRNIATQLCPGVELDAFLSGKEIEVTGAIIDFPTNADPKYRGRKEIIVRAASQI